MMYLVQWEIPYEGLHEEWFYTLEEVVAWIKKNPARFEFSYDNLSVHEVSREIDVYSLMKGG